MHRGGDVIRRGASQPHLYSSSSPSYWAREGWTPGYVLAPNPNEDQEHEQRQKMGLRQRI